LALHRLAAPRRAWPAVKHEVEVRRVLDAEAIVGPAHGADALARRRTFGRAEVRGQALVALHAQLFQDVVDAVEVQVERGGADTTGVREGTCGDALRSVGAVELPRRPQDGRPEVAACPPGARRGRTSS